jgi:MFS family permease
MLSFGLTAIAFAFFFAVEALPAPIRPEWLLTWNTFAWIGAALYLVNTVPYLAAITRPSERGYAFAMQSAILPLMAFAGGLVAGQLPGLFAGLLGQSLDQPAPYRYGLWLVPVAYVLALLIFSRAQPVSLGDGATSEYAHMRPPVATLLIFGAIAILQSVGDGVLQAFFNVYLDRGLRLLPAQIGAIIGIASLLPAVAALTSAPIMKRLGTGETMGLSSAGMGAFLALMAIWPTVAAAAIGRMAAGAMASMTAPSRNVFSQEIVEPRWRTTSSAVLTMALGLGWALAAAAGGALIRVLGFGGVFMLGGILGLVSAALTFGFLRARQARRLRTEMSSPS